MRRIKFQIKNNDQSMVIPLKGINNLSGYDDDVFSTVERETEKSINESRDAETRRILPATSVSIMFQFYNSNTATYITQIAPNEFNSSEYTSNAAKKSFFIIQLFDSYKDESNSKKHTGYFNGFEFAKNNLSSIYTFSRDLEFTNLYVGQNVLDSLSGVTTEFYIKFLFYSAKSGKFYSFRNWNTGANTQEGMYHRILINPTTRTYSFNPVYSPIILRELVNPDYDNFINNTVESIEVQKPVYPAGNTFNNEGNYVTI